ncbi:MAG: nicotinate-nicotinamide nucleotide adenylyltransferase, partial [Chloroflexota bacterium]
TAEIDHAGPSYTVDTIAGLKQKLGAGAELYFILGWDSLAGLPGWKEPARLIEMCRLVAVPRPGYASPGTDSLEAAVPGLARRLVLLDGPEVPVSATEIRQRVARGQSIRRLVPAAVAEYIERNKLYLNQAGGVS